LIDLDDQRVTTLLADDLRFLWPLEWPESQKIILFQYHAAGKFKLDLNTMMMTEVEE